MKQLSKDQWRKIHGIKEPKDPADPNVVARRKLHEAIIKWELKWITRLHLAFAFLAFFIVFLPTINKTWHGFVAFVPIVLWIHRGFSSFGGLLSLSLAVALFCNFYSARKIDGESFSEYGYPINLTNIRSSENIVLGDLYPRTRLEEKFFLLIVLAGFGWQHCFGLLPSV